MTQQFFYHRKNNYTITTLRGEIFHFHHINEVCRFFEHFIGSKHRSNRLYWSRLYHFVKNNTAVSESLSHYSDNKKFIHYPSDINNLSCFSVRTIKTPFYFSCNKNIISQIEEKYNQAEPWKNHHFFNAKHFKKAKRSLKTTHTHNEKKANCDLNEQQKWLENEYGMNIKGTKRRSNRFLEQIDDDDYRSNASIKNWKHNRKTQYK